MGVSKRELDHLAIQPTTRDRSVVRRTARASMASDMLGTVQRKLGSDRHDKSRE